MEKSWIAILFMDQVFMCLTFAIHVFSKFILRITLTSQGKKVLQFSFFNIAYLSPMNKYLACSNVNYCLNLENSEAWNWICIHSFFMSHLRFENRSTEVKCLSDIIYLQGCFNYIYCKTNTFTIQFNRNMS